jgi:HPt (histidine-containing phosphotransfer) domain-containing protein
MPAPPWRALSSGEYDMTSRISERPQALIGVTEGDDTGSAGDDTLTPLRSILEPAAFREIVELYDSTIRKTVAAMVAAARRSDFRDVRQQAHDLAGMCGQIGSDRCTTLARRIEAACIEGRDADAAALVPEIEPAAADTLAALGALIHTTAGR